MILCHVLSPALRSFGQFDLGIAFDELLSDWRGLDVDVGLRVALASAYPTTGMTETEGRMRLHGYRQCDRSGGTAE